VHLVNNALKFTAEGSATMHCSLADEGQRIVYSVTDTGIGIPAEKAEVIFERFKQLDTFVPGLGLGLSICRMIATELGGEVVLDTNYHGGACFLFTLPK
jgi:signal transduction histidine kinase